MRDIALYIYTEHLERLVRYNGLYHKTQKVLIHFLLHHRAYDFLNLIGYKVHAIFFFYVTERLGKL